ncbi:MAG: amino acid ABC transporter permease [Synechococcales cyanobacterium C42_A2020_086]|jgi:general L-amino acid transport system permease protein|nr:amino acid ABC transporter permease [Synechococcales cyanobacterium C42_A2020_086]
MSLDPPPLCRSPRWTQKLFDTPLNSLLSVVFLMAIVPGITAVLIWATTQAQWSVLAANVKLFLVGRYPVEWLWRLRIAVALLALVGGMAWGSVQRPQQPWQPLRNRSFLIGVAVAVGIAVMPMVLVAKLSLMLPILLVLLGDGLGRNLPLLRWLPLLGVVSGASLLWLIRGGLGLQQVATANWGGLLLTLFTAAVSLVLSFPLGVLLAFGRQSSLPVLRLTSTIYIEVLRGLPLIGVLFMALVMLPLLLPPDWTRPDPLIAATLGLAMTAAAYLAEVVRGGLQAIPRGQLEAARALGLHPVLTIALVLLPQALRLVLPALAGEAITLFKTTTLLSVFGFMELLGISSSVLANPDFIGRHAEVYLFIGAIYWAFCYLISRVSQSLENRLLDSR